MDCTETRTVRGYLSHYSSILWAVGLLLLAAILWHFSRKYPEMEILRPLAEFCGLAGALTITVDPFLKRKLQQEAGRDIFHHLLGLDLPVEIGETLRDFLQENRFYRKDVYISATVRRDGDRVEVVVEISATVVAVNRVSYCQHIALEESERGELLQASVTSTAFPKKSYSRNGNELELKECKERMVQEWTGEKIDLTRGEELSTFIKIRLHGPLRDFHTLNFGSSVIHPRVRLEVSDDLEVAIDRPDQTNGNEHIYKKVFLNGDHIQIRWKPKDEQDAVTQA